MAWTNRPRVLKPLNSWAHSTRIWQTTRIANTPGSRKSAAKSPRCSNALCVTATGPPAKARPRQSSSKPAAGALDKPNFTVSAITVATPNRLSATACSPASNAIRSVFTSTTSKRTTNRELQFRPAIPRDLSYASGPTVIPFNIQPDSENPIIVQGFFDALTADLAGIPGVVSTMYQELNVNHLYKLKACGAEAFTVILRREEDRRNQELKIQKYLKLAEQMHMSLKSIVLPKDETVDTFVRKNGADKLLDLISKTEVDTIHSHRRSMLLQDIKENFDTAMACPPDQSVGYKLSTFPKLTQEIDGVQSGCFFVSSHPFGLKTFLLSSLTLDLIESNPNLKVIYVAYETPRRQIFDRLVSMLIGQSILTVRKQNTDNEINKKILDATRDLMGYVRNNRLEIWDDMPSLDFSDLLKTLSQELKDHPDLILVIDGIDHMKITDRPELPDIHEKRSSIMLDLYKALDIPIFLGGELIDSNMGLLGPRAYLRDSDAIYWLTEKDGVLNLSVDSRRLGSSRIYENKISMDPQSSRMKEA